MEKLFIQKILKSGILNEDDLPEELKEMNNSLESYLDRRNQAKTGLMNILTRLQGKSSVALLNTLHNKATQGKEVQVGLLNLLQNRIEQITPITILVAICIDNYGIEDFFEEEVEYEIIEVGEKTLIALDIYGEEKEVFLNKFSATAEREICK